MSLTKYLGVQYIYEKLADENIVNDGSKLVLSSIDLAILRLMSDEWRSQLSEAAIEGDSNQVRKLIEEIPNQKSHLVKVFGKLARQFQFDEIINLIESLINYE